MPDSKERAEAYLAKKIDEAFTRPPPKPLKPARVAAGRVERALRELATTAHVAIGHVGKANYEDRELEAKGWIEKKLAKLISRLKLHEPRKP